MRLGLIITLVKPLSLLYSDVLRNELFGSEVVQELLRSDESALLVSILEQDLVEALDDGLHYLFEAEGHRLLLLAVRTYVIAKLLVNLLNDSVQPITHVRVNQLDLLGHLNCLVVELLGRLNLHVELVDFGIS